MEMDDERWKRSEKKDEEKMEQIYFDCHDYVLFIPHLLHIAFYARLFR